MYPDCKCCRQVEWLYLVTPSRWLVAQVAVTRLCWREASTKEKITWGRRVSKVNIYISTQYLQYIYR